jgi:hypothetical protein
MVWFLHKQIRFGLGLRIRLLAIFHSFVKGLLSLLWESYTENNCAFHCPPKKTKLASPCHKNLAPPTLQHEVKPGNDRDLRSPPERTAQRAFDRHEIARISKVYHATDDTVKARFA